MPYSTRIVEQKHEQLRNALRERVGQSYTDVQQQYITNNDYVYLEERQVYERKRKDDEQSELNNDDNNTTNNNNNKKKISHCHKGIQHDETKILIKNLEKMCWNLVK